MMIIYLLMLVLSPLALFAQTSSDMEAIQFGAAYGDELVVSGSGSLSYENVRVDSLGTKAKAYNKLMLSHKTPDSDIVFFNSEQIDLDMTFDTVKLWCRESSVRKKPSDESYDQNWEWAYDGEKLELLRLDGLGKDNLIVPSASIRAKNDFPLWKFDPRYYGLSIMGESVSSFLAGSLGDDTVADIALTGADVIGDVTCSVVQGTMKSTGETITVWLVPEYMYRPKKIEIKGADERTEITTSFKHYGDDIWFPAIVQKNIYYDDTVTEKEILYSREILTVTEDFTLNGDISSQVFEIDFPVGMNVFDARTGKSFEIK